MGESNMKNNYNIKLSKEHYLKGYDDFRRWISYYNQFNLLINYADKKQKILEIGVGSKFLNSQAKRIGLNIKSLDFDEKLEPDIVGNILEMPLKSNSYDLCCAFEVLEHIPFNKFKDALIEMKRVSKKYVIFSIPYKHLKLHLSFKFIPYTNIRSFEIQIPLFFINHKFSKKSQHYWECGKKGFSKKIIKNEIAKTGLKIIETFVPHKTEHLFFILSK
jgi:ubiquinone/menaquinone biosynthesis C-methylase UbiE